MQDLRCSAEGSLHYLVASAFTRVLECGRKPAEGDAFWDGLSASTPRRKIMFLIVCLKHWKQGGIAT